MTTLSPGQNVSLTVTGTDAAGNPAPVQAITPTVDAHEIVYVAQDSGHPQNLTVVARGPLGAANLSVNAQDANGNALPTQVDTFTVVAGPATIIAVAIGTPAKDDITTPHMPAGW
jgi:hypothetical protein